MTSDETAGFDHQGYTLYLLARASELASAEFHAELATRGVPVPVWRVLAVLWAGEAPVGRLAAACLVKQPTMTKLLDRMAADGLVTRRRGAARDRRAVRVALTDAGRAGAAALIPLARAHEARLLAEAPAEDAAALRRALAAFIARREGRGTGPADMRAPDRPAPGGQPEGPALPSAPTAGAAPASPAEAQHDRDPSRRRRALS